MASVFESSCFLLLPVNENSQTKTSKVRDDKLGDEGSYAEEGPDENLEPEESG
jgi:hypothetical protein